MTTELTYSEVSAHSSSKDLYLVIHDKVYDATAFIDEHPGGEEVLLDVGGVDATEAFEDVGHSDEAREILDGMLVGPLKRMPGDPKPSVKPPAPIVSDPGAAASGGLGVGLYMALVVAGVAGFVGWKYYSAQQATGAA
ncbi:MAG: hypothetical protein M1814_004930 [Vezdaea aestivalis]|nr:MAG: hypothetical protein M1814_004930 [Vezdaea aestivalis]